MKPYSLAACAFFLLFAAFSGKVKRDVARKESLDSFSGPVSYGARPPDFELRSADGTSYRLEDQAKGKKVVLINFWATWCAPCRLEMPALESLYERHRDAGLEILAINVREDPEIVEAFLQKRPLSFPVLLDRDGLIATRYRVEAFPTTLLLDSEGQVFDVTEGLNPYLAYAVEAQLDGKGDEEDEDEP